jgi:CIC family chloride channel protein
VATGTAQVIFRDSVYTLTLRRRGVRLGGGGDLNLLRRLTVEQVTMEPVASISGEEPFEQLLALTEASNASDFVVLDRNGTYAGMVVADDIKTALLQREAIPLLLVGELARPELPCVKSTEDLAAVLETFSRYEVARLPVCLAHNPGRIIGLVSRKALMGRYHQALSGG